MVKPPGGEYTTVEYGVNFQLLAVMLLKLPNGALSVAVDHRQLWTMASETDSINRQLPSTLHRAVPPQLHVLHANAGYKSQDKLQPVSREHATFGMPV